MTSPPTRTTLSQDGVEVWEIPEHEAFGIRNDAACVVIERASWHACVHARTRFNANCRSEREACAILLDKLKDALATLEAHMETL